MLLQSAAIVVKKLLVDLLGVICKVLNRMVKHFAFLKNVCYQYLNFVLGVTHCFFYELLIGQQATVSECTLLFPESDWSALY